MSTKSLAVVPNLDGHIKHLRRFHQAAMVAVNQGVAAAILTGLELLALQESLKKCKSCTIKEWLSNHSEELGFSERTAFNYTKLAAGMKNRLAAHPHLSALLSMAPSQMSEEHQLTLMKALNKSVDGESLNALYLDFGIVKPARHVPENPNPANNGSATRKATPTALLIQDELFGRLDKAGAVMEWWGKPVKLPGSRVAVPLWQTMSEAEKRAIEKKLLKTKADAEHMLAQLKEARRK